MESKGLAKIVKDFFEDMRKDYAGQRVMQYIQRQIKQGRNLVAIIEDPYVKNRVTDEKTAELLSTPEIIKAVETAFKQAFEDEDFAFKE